MSCSWDSTIWPEPLLLGSSGGAETFTLHVADVPSAMKDSAVQRSPIADFSIPGNVRSVFTYSKEQTLFSHINDSISQPLTFPIAGWIGLTQNDRTERPAEFIPPTSLRMSWYSLCALCCCCSRRCSAFCAVSDSFMLWLIK